MTELRAVPQPHGGPRCPMDDGLNLAHRAVVRTTDAWYAALPRDADGELPDEHGQIYDAAQDAIPPGMALYHVQSSTPYGASEGRYTIVTAWFFRCPICGFVLPATSAEVPRG